MKLRGKKTKIEQTNIKGREELNGKASKGETKLCTALEAAGFEYEYELDKFSYTSEHTYTPDFGIPLCEGPKLLVEYKEYFRRSDEAKKYRDFKKCHPEVNLIFVIKNPSRQIAWSTYTMKQWCDRYGFPCYTPRQFLNYLEELRANNVIPRKN